MRRLLLLFVVMPVAALVGCGYSLVRPDQIGAGPVRSVFVEVRGSGRYDPEMADALAHGLRRALRRDGRFRVAASREQADAVLAVDLVETRIEAVAFDEFDEVLDYEMTTRVRARLESTDGSTLWSADDLGATRAHAAVPGAIVTTSSAFQGGERLTEQDLAGLDNVELGESRKQHAAATLAEDIAETILRRLGEGR
ncbi:MAG: hypothetical protein D6760_00090 [Deltaproteobacteria bacterium]|nr:MAG: hypothetical protein D6760_00090 [Deltaproteobacteria bacterium]